MSAFIFVKDIARLVSWFETLKSISNEYDFDLFLPENYKLLIFEVIIEFLFVILSIINIVLLFKKTPEIKYSYEEYKEQKQAKKKQKLQEKLEKLEKGE
jgi:hypothetical protein